MRGWRIVRPAYAANPLSGAGAARWGNRWNSTGVRIGYAATSRPLAVLEMLVHVSRENMPLDTVLVPLEIPDDLVTELADWPDGWNDFPYSVSSRRVGDRWIEQAPALAMLVPSAVLPSERNILINPAHEHFRKIQIGDPEPDAMDKRLFRLK